jgi:hypothetical protein
MTAPSNHTTTTTTTTINGLPATYARIQTTDGSYAIVKILNVPEFPTSPPQPPLPPVNSNNNSNKVIKQYRCGNTELPYRIIDPSLYDESELNWFGDSNPKIPEPMRLVMIQALRCYLCGDMQPSDDMIHQERVGEHPYGYRYCTDCKPYFRMGLFNTIAPIWRIRLQHENPLISGGFETPTVWVARTRYDAVTGDRIRMGSAPYKYTQWNIVRWITLTYVDNYRAEHDPTYPGCEDCVIVSDDQFTKLASVKNIFIANYGSIADPAYDPNLDDPLNKYSDSEKTQMFEAARKTAIFI